MPSEADFDRFWKSHELAVAVATAALNFLGDHDYDSFVLAVRCARQQHPDATPDLPRRPRPALRLVSGD